MSEKMQLAMELRGIAYDGYNAYKGIYEGGSVLGYVEAGLDVGTVGLSIWRMKIGAGLGSSILAWKANELKLTVSVARLGEAVNEIKAAQANGDPNPDYSKAISASLGVVSSVAGLIGSIPGLTYKISFAANAVALFADAGKEAVPVLARLLGDLDRSLSDAGTDPESDRPSDKDVDRWTDAENTTSPLLLDLNGDGVKTLNQTAGKHFDHAGDGFAERTGWVDADDGLLVRDLDGDGKITSGREFFGNHTRLSKGDNKGKQAAHGFEALAELDDNQDGVVDDKDSGFASLRVWRDANGNGKTDTDELLTLAQAGVKSLDVGYTDASRTEADAQGNAHRQLGSYTTSEGATRGMNDVWFATRGWDSVDQRPLAQVSAAIEALPDLSGSGTLGSLHQAMARDATGQFWMYPAQSHSLLAPGRYPSTKQFANSCR